MVKSLLGEREYTAAPSLDDRPSGALCECMINRVTAIWGLALGCLVVLAVGCATATDRAAIRPASRISVTFVQPERFTDVDSLLASPKGTADLLAEIDRDLHAAGERYVPAGLALEIQVTNIDLAGEFEPWRGPQFQRIRIMRDIYVPRFELTFRLTDGTGAVVKEGRRVLVDQLYLNSAALNDGDPLYYDKLLLRGWLRQELASGAQASRPSP
jgi:Protein of unknown function (DUF3016)